jgi:hypothetical protein
LGDAEIVGAARRNDETGCKVLFILSVPAQSAAETLQSFFAALPRVIRLLKIVGDSRRRLPLAIRVAAMRTARIFIVR